MLKIESLSVELEADAGLVRAIDGLSLAIAHGETFALVGESGCGKSMTALALMRLLPDNGQVTAGDVSLSGREGAAPVDVLGLSERAMRAVRGRRIGMIFQEPGTSLNPVMRVGDQIVESIETHTALRGPAARAKAVQWLQRVGIPEPERRMSDYPFRMSGGQKQRVMIAMTLAAEPDFLVADEPTTALDVTIQAQVLDLLRELQREHGLGLLLITHDLAVVSQMAHRVALMYAGQIVEVARAEDFFSQPQHPYAQALLRALPGPQSRSQPLEAIAGTVPPLWQRFEGCRFAPRCGQALAQCAGTLPPVQTLAGGHEVRCWLPMGGPAQSAAARLAAASVPTVPLASAPLAWVPPVASAPALAPAVRPAGAGQGAAPVPLLRVQNLRVSFPIRSGLLQRVTGHFHAVRDVSFEVAAGQTLALVGESGCGKTTIGKAVVQLLRRLADVQGQALLDGQDLLQIQGATLRAARRQVQIIFQDPFASLNPRLRVAELLQEGLAALQPELDVDARLQRVHTLADQVGLRRDALARFPHEFSGGQRQRIAIARALAVQPRLIVCDEPTSALDVSVQAQILNLLRELQRELGVSYLFITHNMGVVDYIADRVAVMQQGRIEEQGVTAQVLQAPQTEYTRRLMAAVPQLLR
jgi:peptide/nickel transport system ATP-binding protein